MKRIQGLLTSLDANPIPSGDPNRPLTEGWASYGIALGMYDKGFWPTLREALDQAFSGRRSRSDAAGRHVRHAPAERQLRGNGTPVLYAVNCLDHDDGAAEQGRACATFEQAAPTWGGLLAWGEIPVHELAGAGDGQAARAPARRPSWWWGRPATRPRRTRGRSHLARQLEWGAGQPRRRWPHRLPPGQPCRRPGHRGLPARR